MFTGLIQAIGKVIKYDGNRLWLAVPFRNLRVGESIAVDGVCLTIAARKKSNFAFDLGKETQRITTLGSLKAGDRMNLERALRVGDRLGGHWVSGHVEQTGKILRVRRGRQNWWFTFRVPAKIRRYMITKGSVAIDGISLTIARLRGDAINIMIIPHTLTHTTLGRKKAGDSVNIEPDLLAKYVLGESVMRRLAGSPSRRSGGA